MGKLIIFEWLSLDGVFDADYMDTWWEPYDSRERQAYIQEVYNNADAFVMGRATYEFLAPAWSNMHNNEMGVAANFNASPKYIGTNSPLGTPWENSIALEADAVAEIKKLKDKHKTMVLIGSADFAQSLIAANVVDEYKLLVQPAVVGEGERFFKDASATLELAAVDKLPKGVVALHYKAT